MGCFCSKHILSVRKFLRNYVSWHWKKMQNLKENWLVAWKMTYGICLIFMRAVECLKICTLIGCFCPRHIKFEEKLIIGFKIDMKSLVNFHPTTQKSKNFTSKGYFCPKYMSFKLKKYRGVVFYDTEQWWKI